jgi:CcmD family protein
MLATMSTTDQVPYVVISYVVTFLGIGVYTWRMFARARKVAAKVPAKDRPWT